MKKLKNKVWLPILKKMAEYSKSLYNWLMRDVSTLIYTARLAWLHIIVTSTLVKYSFAMTIKYSCDYDYYDPG